MLAKKLAESLGRRKLMLKLLSVNLYDMEENSRMEQEIPEPEEVEEPEVEEAEDGEA